MAANNSTAAQLGRMTMRDSKAMNTAMIAQMR